MPPRPLSQRPLHAEAVIAAWLRASVQGLGVEPAPSIAMGPAA